MVVFAHEDHGQLPKSSKIHGFVEGALVAAAITEEGYTDTLRGEHGAVQRMAGAQGLGGAYDAVGAEQTHLRSGLVHLAGSAAAVAVAPAHKLCHHGVDIGALGDQVTVAAVGGGDVVLLIQQLAEACGNGLLAHIHVHIADDDALLEIGYGIFFKHADQAHHAVHSHQILPGQAEGFVVHNIDSFR